MHQNPAILRHLCLQVCLGMAMWRFSHTKIRDLSFTEFHKFLRQASDTRGLVSPNRTGYTIHHEHGWIKNPEKSGCSASCYSFAH